jgi:mRNA-degrading endonuclease HigB of HigAB toxin-antitoxin module
VGGVENSLGSSSRLWEHLGMTVYGKRLVAKFSQKHADSRKPLARFLSVAEHAMWKHLPEVKETFPAIDFAPKTGNLIFNICGNKISVDRSGELRRTGA